MDDFFNGRVGSDQDNFELAALQYFEELDRHAGRQPFPAPRPDPAAPERAPLVPDEEVMPDLADSGLDSVVLSLMADPAPKPPRPAHAGRLTRPLPRKKAQQSTEAPPPAEQSETLSELARKAAGLFDSLPTEDQLLAYSLLQKLAKAAGKDQ